MLLLCVVGTSWAETGTEKATNTGTKDTDIKGKSYTIAGTYIAGKGGAEATGMGNKGVKFRTGADGARLVFAVNTGYTITDFKLYGVSNYALADGKSEPCIDVTKIEVDGTETTFTGTGNFPAKGSKTAGSILLSGINAAETIAIYFDNSNAAGTQINGYYEITWSTVDAPQPLLTTVSPSSAYVAVGSTKQLTGSFTGGTFTGEWVSDNESVATVSNAGKVTGVAEGTANITYQWTEDQSNDAYKATAAITVVEAFDANSLATIKTYDFANRGATTLTISDKVEGAIFNNANSKNNNVFRCTNEGLTSIAIQEVLSSSKGWTINENGLYEGGNAGRCAAICDVKAGQYIEFYHNSETSFYTKNNGEDDGAKKTPLVEEKGHHVYKVLEDGMVGFELAKGHYVTKVVIYENKSGEPTSLSFSAETATATLGEAFTAPTLTKDPVDLTGIVFTSSNTSVATVDTNTGEVAVVGSGKTTITATFEGNNDYWSATASYELTVVDPNVSTEAVIGYTEEIDGTTLKARALTGADHITIASDLVFGSNIVDYKGTKKDVKIDGTTYKSTDSWRKSQNGTYEGQNVGYKLTVEKGYKMNISHVGAKIAVAEDTYTWYVEILNGAGSQVWKSGEKTTTTASAGSVDADVTEEEAIQGLTGDVTVNLWVKQGGGTKYYSINYLQLTATTAVDTRNTYTMTVSQNIDEAGTVTPADGSDVTEGESVAFTATPKTTHRFVKWTIDGVDYTNNPYVLENVNAAHTAVATFAKRYTVTYNLGKEAGNIGKVLNNVNRGNGYDEKYSADDDTYTIPAYADKYLYKEGYVFNKWEDGDGNQYASGDKIEMTKDITLTPTFKATTQSLAKSCAETVVTWTFAKADILFTDWQSSSKHGYYTKNTEVNGEAIAIPMTIIDGKLGNWGRSDAIAQTNQKTKFTIPAVNGMKVEINDAYVNFSTTTIAGSTGYEGTGTESISYTYEGNDETIDIVIGESGQYLNTIKVTYPQTVTSIAKTISAAGYATLCSELPLDFTGSGVRAYIAKTDDTTVKFTEVTSVPAMTGVLLKGEAGDKTITVAASKTDVSTNALVGVLEETKVNDIFVLMDGAQGVGFYKTENTFTVGANTAYLPASVAPARLFIGFDEEGEATGIEAIERNQQKESVFNLNGQRVAAPQKGLYIVNGKKVVLK